MFESFSGAEILTIAVIALVVFGPGRLPEIARTLGGYLRELKAAVSDLRQGIEQEIGPLRETAQEIKEDISKPVSDVRRTLAETADTAKSAKRDIERSAKGPPPASGAATTGAAAASGGGDTDPKTTDPKTPQARWVAPEPPTGVSPSKVWEGLGDPMPASIHPPPDEDPAQDDQPEERTSTEKEEAGRDDGVTEQSTS